MTEVPDIEIDEDLKKAGFVYRPPESNPEIMNSPVLAEKFAKAKQILNLHFINESIYQEIKNCSTIQEQ